MRITPSPQETSTALQYAVAISDRILRLPLELDCLARTLELSVAVTRVVVLYEPLRPPLAWVPWA